MPVVYNLTIWIIDMNYIGSKYTLLPFITTAVENVVGKDLSDKVFCDLFAGTGIVGRSFKPKVRKIISNDIEYYSYVLNRNYIGNNKQLDSQYDLVEELNALSGIETGFIYKNYCLGGGNGRQYFSDENGRRIDAIRQQIEAWKKSATISEDMYFFLLASLIESSDKVANTASVYGAFLKRLKTTAQKKLSFTPSIYTLDMNEHEVYCQDANSLIKETQGDILYLDPPYNSRQYGANYHMLNTIAEYDSFVPKGKTGLREYVRSPYCSKRTVLESFDSLIREANYNFIFLSYNNEGLMSMKEIETVMSRYGHYDVISQDHHRFRADKKENRNHKSDKTIEYLHILEKI